jgi:hypothetical protein
MLKDFIKKIPFFHAIYKKVTPFIVLIEGYLNIIQMHIVQHRYKKVLAKLQNKLFENNKINVAFFVSQKQLWCGQSLYDEFLKNNNFSPTVFVFPNNEDKINSKKNTLEDNYDFFYQRGINVIKGYDYDTRAYISFKNVSADIIFYDQPSPQIHKSLLWFRLSKKALICYIPYGFKIAAFFDAHFNMPLQNCSWRVFSESEWHKEQFRVYSAFKGKNVITSGLPRLDEYKNSINIIKNSQKTIIWAPHWSIGNSENSYSTFDLNYKFFLDFARNNPTIRWVFKPHQRLRHYLLESGFMTQNEISNYYDEWGNLPNTIFYNEPDYFDIFKSSDGLITDCGSFLAEYLPTKKPILRLIKLDNIRYNEIGQKLVKSYYNSSDIDSISDFINDVIINENDFLKPIRLGNLSLVLPNNGGAGKFICDYIESELDRSP